MEPASSSSMCTPNSCSRESTRVRWRSESQFSTVSMSVAGPTASAGTSSTVPRTWRSAFSFNMRDLDPSGSRGGARGGPDRVGARAVGRFGDDPEPQPVVEVGHLGVLRGRAELRAQLGAAPRGRVGHDRRPEGGLDAPAEDAAAQEDVLDVRAAAVVAKHGRAGEPGAAERVAHDDRPDRTVGAVHEALDLAHAV